MGYTPLVTRPRDASGAAYSGDPHHINANTGTLVSSGPTYLGCIVCNDPGSAWVINVYDGTDATGTLIAAIKPVGGGNYVFDCRCQKGVYVNPTGTTAGSITVVCSPA